MPLPIIFALAGALAGGALGAYGGVQIGASLNSQLTPEQQRAVAQACSVFGIKFGDDVANLSPAEQAELATKLREIKDRGQV